MKKKAKQQSLAPRVVGLVQGKLTGEYVVKGGWLVCRCECGELVQVNARNFFRGTSRKDCNRLECKPVSRKYAKRLARHLARKKAWDDLMAAFGELMKRLKCTCNRNVKPCRECARLRTAIIAGIDAREWVSTDPSFDKQREPVDPRDIEYEPDEDSVSRKVISSWEKAHA